MDNMDRTILHILIIDGLATQGWGKESIAIALDLFAPTYPHLLSRVWLASWILINCGSGNSTLPDSTKSSCEPKLCFHLVSRQNIVNIIK